MTSTIHSLPENEVLDQIFHGLRNQNDSDICLHSAQELRQYLSNHVAESADTVAGEDNVNQRLFYLMHSQIISDKFVGLLAIDHLLDLTSDDTINSKRRLFRFYNYVRSLLPTPDTHLALAASKTLGKIIGLGASAFGEAAMSFQVLEAIEFTNPSMEESSRYAGVLILTEIARNSPTYFHLHISIVFDEVLVLLRNTAIIIREAAAELLAACVEIVVERGHRIQPSPYLSRILADAQAGLNHHQPEIIHGSLLAYRELFLHADKLMREASTDTIKQVERHRSHSSDLVRETAIAILDSLELSAAVPPVLAIRRNPNADEPDSEEAETAASVLNVT